MKTALYTVAGVALLSWFGPTFLDSLGIDDHSTEKLVARVMEDAQRDAAARDRFERMAQRICGPQAAWAEVAPRTVQCYRKTGQPVGRKTRVITGAL